MANPIEYGIFFDDDEVNTHSVAGKLNIKTVKIPKTDGPILEIPISSFVNNASWDGTHEYIDLLRKANVTTDLYDALSGIQEAQIDELNTWLDTIPEDKYKNTAAIFDWDRTLTVFEGIFPYSTILAYINYYGLNDSKDIITNSMLTYLFGGIDRLTMIKDMLDMLSGKGVQIFILTNNGSCPTLNDFKSYVTLLTDKIPETNILCSKPSPYYGNKGNFLYANPKFELLKPALFGGRSKQSRRRNRKTKTLHKKRHAYRRSSSRSKRSI